jgi:hypothetical protein
MDLYVLLLALGGLGLAAMAIVGGGRHHGAHGHGHGGHSHAGHTAGHAAGHGQAAGHGHAVSHGQSHGGHHPSARDAASRSFLSLVSPRILFSLSLGIGTTGLLARGMLGGVVLFAVALGGGILFERLIVNPIWNFGLRFESSPALTLESAIDGEATVVSNFDANGQGLVAIEVDGQVVQILGTLQASDREHHPRLPAGTKVRVQDVDEARNRCTVSLL